MEKTHTAQKARVSEGSAGLSLFRIGGVQIRLDYSWFFIFLLVLTSLSSGYFPSAEPERSVASYWLAGILTTLLFFASLLLHELSHTWVARRAGIEVPRITLFLFGGVSEMKEEPTTPQLELKVAVVGPLMSLALAVAFWLLAGVMPTQPWYAAAVPRYLAWINLALGIFNLLPGYPLDGGRVLRALVWWRTGSLERATRAASSAGRAFGVALIVLGAFEIFLGGLLGGMWLILIGLFLRSMASRGYEAVLLRQALGDATVEEVMTPRSQLVEVPPELTLRRLVDDYFLDQGYRGFPVTEDGQVVGLISLEAVRKVDRERWDGTRVQEVMAPASEANVVPPDTPLFDAMTKLARHPAGRLLVVRDGELVGWITSRDLSRLVELRMLTASE